MKTGFVKEVNDTEEERDEFLEQAQNMTSDQLLARIYASLLHMDEKLDSIDENNTKIKNILTFFEVLLILSLIVSFVVMIGAVK